MDTSGYENTITACSSAFINSMPVAKDTVTSFGKTPFLFVLWHFLWKGGNLDGEIK
jgi:hypothetical protein